MKRYVQEMETCEVQFYFSLGIYKKKFMQWTSLDYDMNKLSMIVNSCENLSFTIDSFHYGNLKGSLVSNAEIVMAYATFK